MDKIKVIISSGTEPLHFLGSAKVLIDRVDLKIITGWVPKISNHFLISITSKLIKRDLKNSFKKRQIKKLEGRILSCYISEFFRWGLTVLFNKNNRIKNTTINGWSFQLYGWESKKFIKDAEIFHVRSGAGQGGAIKIAKAKNMIVIVDHSIAHPLFMEENLRDEFFRNQEEFTYGMDSLLWKLTLKDAEKADILLVNSTFVKTTFLSSGYPEEKIRVITQGVRKDFFGLKSDYELGSKLKILFTGNFGFRKGVEYILKALQILEKKKIAFELTVVGKINASIKLLEKYPLKSINLVGFVKQDDLKAYLSDSDIYLFPSLSEGCASSALEAMASGLPVIATEETGLPIENNKDGIIIPAKDVNAIHDAIIALKKDDKKRESIGRNAAKKIKDNYSWDNYGERVHELYKEMI